MRSNKSKLPRDYQPPAGHRFVPQSLNSRHEHRKDENEYSKERLESWAIVFEFDTVVVDLGLPPLLRRSRRLKCTHTHTLESDLR